MDERLSRMRVRQGAFRKDFLDTHPEWVQKHYEIEGRKALILSKGDRAIPLPFLKSILSYQAGHVIYKDRTNLTRADCFDVAMSFQEAFHTSPEFADFRKQGYEVGYIVAGDATKNPLRFYKERGFAIHVMNVLESFPDREAEVHAALDLTAHYNMDIEQGTMDVFMVIADTEEELKQALFSLTRSKWQDR